MPRSPDTSPQTLLLFDALLADPTGWHYGYSLSKQTGLAPGTLYPILQRVAERGLLQTRWEESDQAGRPPRHAYQLTADGLAYAREKLATRTTAPARRRPRGAPAPRTAS